MAHWKSEDEIKAELRELTSELRKVRQELRGMVEPAPKTNSTRAFLHRQSWPAPSPAPRTRDRRKREPRKPERG